MNAAHQMLTLGKVAPGMVLSDAILDRQGQVLLAQGTVLTVATIGALARHGVTMLPIEVSASDLPQVDVAAVRARLDHVFRHQAEGDTARAVLRGCIEQYRLERGPAP